MTTKKEHNGDVKVMTFFQNAFVQLPFQLLLNKRAQLQEHYC